MIEIRESASRIVMPLTKIFDFVRIAEGEKIQSVKCSACHKLTDEKLVGLGWTGVTKRQKPEWIMIFITDSDPMIDKDPELKKKLEICLVRMPNQSLTDADARNLLEFMRKNDGVKNKIVLFNPKSALGFINFPQADFFRF